MLVAYVGLLLAIVGYMPPEKSLPGREGETNRPVAFFSGLSLRHRGRRRTCHPDTPPATRELDWRRFAGWLGTFAEPVSLILLAAVAVLTR